MKNLDIFKFRIWDKQGNKMWYHDNPDNDLVINCKGEVVKVSISGDRAGYPVFIVEHLDQDSFVKLQCTGLKDKNGKLIYEGDIVEHNFFMICKDCYNSEESEYFEIKWEDIHLNAQNIKTKDFSNGETDNIYFLNESDCKILGSIYENPEYLNNNRG